MPAVNLNTLTSPNNLFGPKDAAPLVINVQDFNRLRATSLVSLIKCRPKMLSPSYLLASNV